MTEIKHLETDLEMDLNQSADSEESQRSRPAPSIYIVEAKYAGMRLDKVLPEVFKEATFGLVQKLCRKGVIRLDDKRVKGNEKVSRGQEVRIPPAMLEGRTEDHKRLLTLSAKDKKMVEGWIMLENDDFVVLNKPYDMPVQAGSGHSKSIDRYMEAYFDSFGEDAPKLIHRLDKATTGCLLLAKNKEVAKELSFAFQGRRIEKIYWAVVYGRLKEREGVIKTSIEKEETDGYEKVEATPHGKKAETHYRVVASAGLFHFLEVRPKTGRMHQIRVHLSSIGVPIVGDIKYGAEKAKAEESIKEGTIFLHARELSFDLDGQMYHLEAPLPEHFKKVFKVMEWSEKDAKQEN